MRRNSDSRIFPHVADYLNSVILAPAVAKYSYDENGASQKYRMDVRCKATWLPCHWMLLKYNRACVCCILPSFS